MAIIIGFLVKTQMTEAPTTNPKLSLNTLTKARDGEKVELLINNSLVTAEIVISEAARSRGLSGRPALGLHEGMLFIFPHDTKPGFWMKEMNFSLDMLWIAADGSVIDISSNIPPDSFPELFYPPTPIRYVLELPAGSAEQWQIKPGDIIHLIAQNHI